MLRLIFGQSRKLERSVAKEDLARLKSREDIRRVVEEFRPLLNYASAVRLSGYHSFGRAY